MSDDNQEKYRVATKRRIRKEEVAEQRKKYRSEIHLMHVPTDRNLPSSGDVRDQAADHPVDNQEVANNESTPWDNLDEFCSVDELTEIIPVDRKTLYNMINNDEIPGSQRFGRKILLHTETVYNWLTDGANKKSSA